jgi:hypothetical protein
VLLHDPRRREAARGRAWRGAVTKSVSCGMRWCGAWRHFGPVTADSDKGPSDSSGRDQPTRPYCRAAS